MRHRRSFRQGGILGVIGGHRFARIKRQRSTMPSIPSAGFVALGSWNEMVERDGPASDLSYNGAAYFTHFTGWAGVRAEVLFAPDNTGARSMRLLSAGHGTLRDVRAPAVPGYPTSLSLEWQGPVSPGQEFAVEVHQSSGTTLALRAAEFAIKRTA